MATQKNNFRIKQIITIALVFLAMGILVSLYVWQSWRLVQMMEGDFKQMATMAEYLPEELKTDQQALTTSLKSTQAVIQTNQQRLNFLLLWRLVPQVGYTLSLAQDFLTQGNSILEELILIDNNFSQLDTVELVNDPSIILKYPSDTQAVMAEALINSTDEIINIAEHVDATLEIVERIKPQRAVASIRDNLTQLKKEVEPLAVWFDSYQDYLFLLNDLPEFIGYPTATNYLLLLQNSNELRPTGGFIGTYGTLTIDKVQPDIFFDNVYNLDAPANAWMDVPPPAPLEKYLLTTQWHLRDANWSPDWPTAAQQAIWFYHEEQGPVEDFRGVIGITPAYIQAIMQVVGDIIIDDTTFTATNIIQEIEAYVGKDFKSEGISEADRKDIIGDLAKAIQQRLMNLSPEKIQVLIGVTLRALQQKDILLYSKNEAITELLQEQNWNGAIVPASHDYLMVVDANLGSLKTDSYIKRNYSYKVSELPSGELQAQLKLDYSNKAGFSWKTTRYRTYTRIYVPLGSKLIEVTGLMDMDRSNKPGKLDEFEEFGKTAWGGFIAIEPGQTGSLTFTYNLPDNIRTAYQNDLYKLYVQKQPGNSSASLRLDYEFDKAVVGYEPDNTWQNGLSEQGIWFQGTITQDQMLVLRFK